MNKKIISSFSLFLIILFFIIFITSCTSHINTPNTPVFSGALKECQVNYRTNIAVDQEGYLIQGTAFIKPECVYSKANTVQDCQNYKGAIIAETDKNENIYFNDKLVDNCIYELAIRNKKVSFCDQARSRESDCYRKFAIDNKQPELCKKTSDSMSCYKEYVSQYNIKQFCSTTIWNFIGQIACLYDQLKLDKDDIIIGKNNFCSVYEDFPFHGEQATSACLAANGVFLEDTSICDKSGEFKGDCYLVLATIIPSFTTNDCDKAGTNYVGCYIAIALKNNNPSICNQIPEGSKGDCMEQIAKKTRNLSLCTNIGIPQGMHCAQQFVAGIKPEEYTLEFCEDISKIGAGTGGPSPNQCFYEVATRTLNVITCDKIVNEDTSKEDCKERINHALQAKI